MKKVFAAVLALVMALSLTTLAFATSIPTDGDNAEITITVNKTIRQGGAETPPTSFSFPLEAFVMHNGEIEKVSGITIEPITKSGEQQLKLTATQDFLHNVEYSDGFFIREGAMPSSEWTSGGEVWYAVIHGVEISATQTVTVYYVNVHTAVYNAERSEYEYNGEDDNRYTSISFTNTYTESSTPRYYYNSTTPTEPAPSPKTFDAGIALYAVLSLTSLTGMAALGRKKF